MALKVTDAATAARRFVERGAAAARDYTDGVRNAGADWQAATAASADNYAAGVQDAITRGAFARGVSQAGAGRYQDRAAGVGSRRFPEGIRDAGPSFTDGVAPYLQTIAGLTLPPRRPKGDPENFRRAEAVGMALRARKVGR